MRTVEIPEHEGYTINELGIVTGKRVKEVKTFRNRNGYDMVTLCNGKRNNLYIHRLLAELFIQNPNRYNYVNHLDGDKRNNSLNNLEWCDRNRNSSHAFELGLNGNVGENHHQATLTDEQVVEIRQKFVKGSKEYGARALGRKYGVHMATILRIVAHKTRSVVVA